MFITYSMNVFETFIVFKIFKYRLKLIEYILLYINIWHAVSIM